MSIDETSIFGGRPVRALHGWHAGLCVAQIRRVVIVRFVVGERLLFSQMAIATSATVPLWKVIAGPRAGKLKPDPQGSGFLFRQSSLRPAWRSELDHVAARERDHIGDD